MCVCVFSFSGNPKGAMLTHENVVADAAGIVKAFDVQMNKLNVFFLMPDVEI